MKKGENECAMSAPRNQDRMVPPSNATPRRGGPEGGGVPVQTDSPDNGVSRRVSDEVGLTSWLGKPLHLPAHREQARVLRHPLEFRKLPCIRGCRLTGLVASSGCRPERGMKPLRERKGKGMGRVGVRGRLWRGLRFTRTLDLSLKRWEDQGERR